MKKVILQKNWQNKGEGMKEFTGSDYPGIAHHFGHCKLNLIIGTCGKQAHCCAQAELESRRWFCRCRRGHPKFHPEIAASWRHIIIQIWDHEGQGELQLNTVLNTTSAPPLTCGFSVHSVLVFQITFPRGHRQEKSAEVTACVAAGLHSQKQHNSSQSKYFITANPSLPRKSSGWY